MYAQYKIHVRHRSGVVYILALMLLALCTTLGVTFSMSANLQLQAAANQGRILNARMSAEGGLDYICYLLRGEVVSAGSDEELLESIADLLRSALEGPGKLPDGSITCDGQTVAVPPFSYTGASGSFSVAVAIMPDSMVGLTVTGLCGAARRLAGLRMAVQGGGGASFAHGIITNGPLRVAGNGKIRGANDPSEAQVYSATTENLVFDLSGNSYIEGDVFATNPNGTYSLTGNSKIAGCRGNDPELPDHAHMGAPPFDIPEVDGSPFEPFATNIVDGNRSGNYSLSNIRIPAGTNPRFSGNYTISGVIYIETPNIVTFTGNTTIKGVIVTEDAGDEAYNANKIEFQGNTTLNGVDSLPDLPEYTALKDLPGSLILAPGFGLDFHGNFGTVAGCMAADKFSFYGNSGGTIYGSIINYGQTEMVMQGNSTFWFDQSNAVDNPSGFASGGAAVLVIVAQSYTES